MKKIYALLVLFFFLNQVLAQENITNGGPWMLEKIVIDGTEYLNNFTIEHHFTDNQSTLAHWECYENVFSEITYPDEFSFLLNFNQATGDSCEPPIEIFEKHREFYYNASEIAYNPFSYEVLPGNQLPTLIITNNQGAKAYYSSYYIGTNFPEVENIFLYPNPTRNTIRLQGFNSLEIDNISILTISGKLVKFEKQFVLEDVDISFLQNGLYLLKVTTSNGREFIKKFLKN